MFEEMRLAALLAKTVANDPTVLPAVEALKMATIGVARALHMANVTGSLEPGKRADMIVVDMDGMHNWPHFHSHDEAIYSRLVYAAKSTDVAHVICDGRWLMRERQLLTVDEEQIKREATGAAAEIDTFVTKRESSPYNKLVLLSGMQRQESFEIQVKVPVDNVEHILAVLETDELAITKQAHYRQFDSYFVFEANDPDAARLRFRDDEFVDDEGKVYEARSRLTLLGETSEQEYPNAVMLSRSRWLAPAEQSLRFYREYFAPDNEVEVHKDRRRWRIIYRDTDFALNLDQVIKPKMDGHFLEIKSRTWSRTDAERKAGLITELLQLFGVEPATAEPKDYPDLALSRVSAG
jgi:5-methylthioadenosine/S-adenosylhomocysteine deaminase